MPLRRDTMPLSGSAPNKNPHQTGLARAIAPNETQLLPLVHAHGRIIEDLLRAELEAEVFGGNDGGSDRGHGRRTDHTMRPGSRRDGDGERFIRADLM